MMISQMSAEDVKTVQTAAGKAIYKACGILSKEVIADITQETFLRLIQVFDPERGTIGQIAYTTARNLCFDYTRGRAHLGEHKGTSGFAQETEDGTHGLTMDQVESTGPTALDGMIIAERDADLAAAIADLTPTMQAVISKKLDDEHEDRLTGADRVASHRAVKALQDILVTGKVTKAVKRAKPAKSLPVEAEIVEAAPQRGLSIVSRWMYQAGMLDASRLTDIKRVA